MNNRSLYRVGIAVQRAFQGPIESMIELTLADSADAASRQVRDRYSSAADLEIYAIEASTY